MSDDGKSTTSLAPSQGAWPRPKSPLPPHRLAMLANALGVSTPQPATGSSISYLSNNSTGQSSFNTDRGKSPTPSSVSTFTSSGQTTSKFLLHIIPPLTLPHELGGPGNALTPPPSNAYGYHTQFRRGTLVPFHSSMQSQMLAIAKEYALPSTAGMILYLVSGNTPRSDEPRRALTPEPESTDEEPGPRLSDDIWKHLWNRVSLAEQLEEPSSPGDSPGFESRFPNGGGNGYSNGASDVQPLRPLFSPMHLNASKTSLSTTPSSVSTHFGKSVRKDSSSQASEPDSPNTSNEWDHNDRIDPRAEALHLPGLKSPSLIPILAKVEFDIDRRKAAWFDPWVRSRRMNQLKRLGKSQTSDDNDGPSLIPLKLGTSHGLPNVLGESDRLTDSPEPNDRVYDPQRGVPAPLALQKSTSQQSGSSDTSFLPYLKEGEDPNYSYDMRRKSTDERREGGVFDDLNFGFDSVCPIYGIDWTKAHLFLVRRR